MLKISSFNNVNNNFRNHCQNFGYRLPVEPVSDFREIKHNKCACCGHDTFTQTEVNSFVRTFQAGSKRALENSLMEKYKNTTAYDFLKGLSFKEPKKTIKELMLTQEAQRKFRGLDYSAQIMTGEIAALADNITVKAPRAIQKLEKFYDFWDKEDKEIFDLMTVYAEKYPKKTFAEIFSMPEIAQKHTSLSEMYKNQARTQRIEVFKRVREFSKDWPLQDAKKLLVANNDALKILLNEYYKPHIKKVCVEEIYNDFLKSCSKKRIRKKLFDILKDLPYETSAADDYIALCASQKTSDTEIVRKFAEQMQATFEHVLAKSDGGEDVIGNGIVLCKKCNNERSNIKYTIFLKIHPEMKKNIQKQINKIITYIKHDKLKGFENYPMEIKQTLLTQTDNILKIKIQKYLKYREQQAIQRLKLSKASFERDMQKTKEADSKLKDIESRLEELLSTVKQLKKEKHRIIESLEQTNESLSYLEQVVNSNETELLNIQKLIDEDTIINQTVKPKKI